MPERTEQFNSEGKSLEEKKIKYKGKIIEVANLLIDNYNNKKIKNSYYNNQLTILWFCFNIVIECSNPSLKEQLIQKALELHKKIEDVRYAKGTREEKLAFIKEVKASLKEFCEALD